MKYYLWIIISATIFGKSLTKDGMEWLVLPSA